MNIFMLILILFQKQQIQRIQRRGGNLAGQVCADRAAQYKGLEFAPPEDSAQHAHHGILVMPGCTARWVCSLTTNSHVCHLFHLSLKTVRYLSNLKFPFILFEVKIIARSNAFSRFNTDKILLWIA